MTTKAKAINIIICAVFITNILFAGVYPVQGKAVKSNGPKPGFDFNGPHYTLNVLRKRNIGNGSYDNPDRHTIFVPLEGETTITYILGADFGVLDGNGLDDGISVLQIPHGQDKNFMVYLVSLGKPGNGTDVIMWIIGHTTMRQVNGCTSLDPFPLLGTRANLNGSTLLMSST